MSMTSKVNLALRNTLVRFLQPGITATNNGLKKHVAPSVSLRAVQEATQKLTREGVLEQTKSNGRTWYGIRQTKTVEVFPGLENTSVSIPVAQ
jgi:hypothetical protein